MPAEGSARRQTVMYAGTNTTIGGIISAASMPAMITFLRIGRA
ncbi:hypothetical protein [Streptomyces sp. KL116D]